MHVLIAASEVTPFSKTGGLADVCGAIPQAIARRGHRATVISPAYRQVYRSGIPFEPPEGPFSVPVGNGKRTGHLVRSRLPDSDVEVLFVDQPEYFDRPELYQEQGRDYSDNCERFVFFCRAVMEVMRNSDPPVDVVHCNDWQTGLVPAYLRIEHGGDPKFDRIASLMTIHNMAYQGQFWHWDMVLTGLDWSYFNWRQLEFYGNLNLLKTGLVFADAISTVSPTYAREIQTQPHGCGLEGVLQQRREHLFGIINGIDTRVWNPQTDDKLEANYDAGNWTVGKPICKQSLQKRLGLARSPKTPVIGFIGRLAEQKGCDLFAEVIRRWVGQVDAQWAILGTGDPAFHELFSELARDNPHRIAARLEFSDDLAHRIEAGADILLMPSRYEPCGLNQLYSLRYGTVPVVRETGGLADTVVDADEASLAASTATGFTFKSFDANSLEVALQRCVTMYQESPDVWRQIVETGMRQDWSWDRSAERYVELYESLISGRRV